ncbi:unnamed protein product, partial [Allacma fusca]
IFFMQEIVLASFIAIRSSESSIVVVKMISGLNAAQVLITASKFSGRIHEKSAELLAERRNSNRCVPIRRRIQRSLRPLYTWFGGLYFADKHLTFTVLEITLGHTIDLLLAN